MVAYPLQQSLDSGADMRRYPGPMAKSRPDLPGQALPGRQFPPQLHDLGFPLHTYCTLGTL